MPGGERVELELLLLVELSARIDDAFEGGQPPDLGAEGVLLAVERLVGFAAADFELGIALVVVEHSVDAEPLAREEEQLPLFGVAVERGEEQPHRLHALLVGDVVPAAERRGGRIAAGLEAALKRGVFDAVERRVVERRRDAGRLAVAAARDGRQQHEQNKRFLHGVVLFEGWVYRILSVTSVMAASSSEIIQKRTTIFVSKMFFFW